MQNVTANLGQEQEPIKMTEWEKILLGGNKSGNLHSGGTVDA